MSTARVLILDENSRAGETARQALASLATVDVCPGREALLAALESTAVDLVLVAADAELVAHIRRAAPATRVIVMSTQDGECGGAEAVRAGAGTSLTLPLRPDALYRAADRLLTEARLEQENARLRGTLDTLESCARLVRCLEPDDIYDLAVELLLSGLGRSRGLAQFRRTSMPVSDGLALRGFSRREGRRLRDVLIEDERLPLDDVDGIGTVTASALHDLLDNSGIRVGPALAIPLRGRERECGVIYVLEDGAPFDATALERAQRIAGYAELALCNAERYYGAKERAFIDDVTGTHNARYLLDAIDQEFQRADRYGHDVCILFLDIDRFKIVNDRHGHLVGTQTLRHVSQVMARHIRQVDTLARYGGDEFTILLSDTAPEKGQEVAERIREAIAQSPFTIGGGTEVPLTISIGVSCYPRDSRTRDELLHLADRAMYRAKSLGRDRVSVATDLVI